MNMAPRHSKEKRSMTRTLLSGLILVSLTITQTARASGRMTVRMILALFLASGTCLAQSPAQAPAPVAATGQTSCYTYDAQTQVWSEAQSCSGIVGQDGAAHAG